jgi:integrase
LAFSRIIVLRYRIHLERSHYAPATINLHLASVRRLAYEVTDAGLLSAELAAGIHRVKGVRRLGIRTGNWLTAEQGRAVLESPSINNLRGKRDRAILALHLGCGLRRAEVVQLSWEHLQLREDHWVIADFLGKGGHVRTVPVPGWVKVRVDEWRRAARIRRGRVFRPVNKGGRVCGRGITPKVIWHIVRTAAKRAGIQEVAPHDLRRTCARLCHLGGGELEQIQSLLGHVSIQTTERYLGCKQKLRCAVNDRMGIEPDAPR